MGKKTFTKKQIQNIKDIIDKKNFLERLDVVSIGKEVGFCQTVTQRELLENKIPFKSGNVKITLNSIGIECDGKKINLSKIKKLNEWKIEMIKNSKIKIVFLCDECGGNGCIAARNLINRKYFALEPLCKKCILKKTTNTKEWKSINSKAQLIAQNKPEQKEKNRLAQIKRFKNPVEIKKHSKASKEVWKREGYKEKMKKIAARKWEDLDYAERVIKNSKKSFICGYYNSLYYDSGYELAFLMNMESKGLLHNIKRVKFFIEYEDKNGRIRKYFPDFFCDDMLFEIKGYGYWIDLENLNKKNIAAKEWCKKNGKKYRVVELKDFGYSWYRKARLKHKELIEKNGKIKKKNCKKV